MVIRSKTKPTSNSSLKPSGINGVFMRSNFKGALRQTVFLFGVVAPCAVWAQALPANTKADAPVAVAAVNQSVSAEVSKPHDDSFVIGANDVLAINVWKEPDV